MGFRLYRLARVADLSAPTKNTLKELCLQADDDKAIVWQGIAYLMRHTGFGRTAVKAALRDLRRRGILQEVGRVKVTNGTIPEYLINVDAIKGMELPPDPSAEAEKPTGPGRVATPTGSRGDPLPGRVATPYNLINTYKNQHTVKLPDFGELPLGAETVPLFPGQGPARHSLEEALQAAFGVFWDAYPRQVKRKDARREFDRAVLSQQIHPTVILEAAKAFASRCLSQEIPANYIPHASTWLKGERWADDYSGEPMGVNPGGMSQESRQAAIQNALMQIAHDADMLPAPLPVDDRKEQ